MSDTRTNVSINRQHKDRLFTMIFGATSNKKNILSLYDTHYTNEEDVLADFLRKHRGDVMSNCLTEFNEEVYKKGLLEEGLRTACVENATNLFKNGVSYELVRASITQLTDEELQAIYSDVTGKEFKK